MSQPSDLIAQLGPLAEAILAVPGDADPALRRAIEARAASLGGRATEPVEVPGEIVRYVDTVATEAHRVTDADVDALKQGGYSEDAIYEITLSAALGAAMARLERGVAALQGDG